MSNRPYTWKNQEETHEYDDILNLPHYVSETRPHMSMIDRAAQFSPFDALTGFDDNITEEGRLTDQQFALSEQQMDVLNGKLARLSELCAEAQHERFFGGGEKESPVVTVQYFVSDAKLHKHSKKGGGEYLSYTGPVKRIDMIEGRLFFKGERPGQKEKVIPIADIIEISSEELDKVMNWYE
jgi:hypothetical protein